MNRSRRSASGFTMIELMVVVSVVGVLAAIAVPIYGTYARNARVSEAHSRIGDILTAAKSFSGEHPDSQGRPLWPPVAGEYGLVDLSPTENFTYAITAGGGQAADATALEITATGRNRMSGVVVRMSVPTVFDNGSAPDIVGL